MIHMYPSYADACLPACAAACLLSVLLGTDVSASVTLAIGTDCVGAFDEDFGACNNVCGAGEKYKFYHIVSDSKSPTNSDLLLSSADIRVLGMLTCPAVAEDAQHWRLPLSVCW
jgi:hypothetical protein